MSKPKVDNGFRLVDYYNKSKFYFIVTDKDIMNFFEFENTSELDDTRATLNLVCRLLSKLMGLGYPMQDAIGQCEASQITQSEKTIPAMVARVMRKYMEG